MPLIAICGPSGSGKTTLARRLAESLNSAPVLSQDDYYRDDPLLTSEERRLRNYDHPDAIDHDLLFEDVCALLKGRSVPRKGYDFTAHRRRDPGDLLPPSDTVILEGIHAFYDPRIREMCDLRVFLQVDADECLLRRLLRDVRDRGRTPESVAEQYLTQVKPMYETYIRPLARYAHIIVPDGGKNDAAFRTILSFLRDLKA